MVIPAYNAAPWIAACLDSLRRQTHYAWTAVVVDDGSQDGTAERAAAFLDDRVCLIRQANAGVSAARNAGIAALPGTDAVLFLDADDLLAPDALARLTQALERDPRAIAAAGPAAFVRSDGSVRATLAPPHGDILSRLVVRNLFANGGHVLIRTHALHAAGEFLPSLAFGEDWELWVRVALRGPFARPPAPRFCWSGVRMRAPICAWPATPKLSAAASMRSSPTPMWLRASVPVSIVLAVAPKPRRAGRAAAP